MHFSQVDQEKRQDSGIAVAAAQCGAVKGKIRENILIHKRFVCAAARNRADMVIFPELSLTGCEPQLAKDCSVNPDDKRLNALKLLSERYRMVIAAGAPVAGGKGKPFIGSIIFLPGKTPLVYTKHHLHDGEEVFFSVGRKNPFVKIQKERISLAICADIVHPEHARTAAANDISVYAAGVLISVSGYETDTGFLETYARTHKMMVVMANYGAPTGEYTAAGKSAVWHPGGQLLAQAPPCGDYLVMAVKGKTGWSGRVEPVRPAP